MTDDRPPDDPTAGPSDDRPPDDEEFDGDEPPAEESSADDDPTDDPFADDPSKQPRDAPDRSGGWLGSVLDVLDRLESLSASGERRGDRSRIDYDVSVRTGLDDLESRDRGTKRGGRGGPPEGRSSRHESGGRERRKRDLGPSTDQFPVSTQRRDDELLVSADVAGVDRDDVTVGFDDGTLVVGIDGSELERVSVPWEDPGANATVKNGVLTVTVTPGDRDE